MNTKKKCGLLLMGLLISGCVGTRKDLGRSGVITIQTEDAKYAEVVTPSVYEENGDVIVSGEVRRSPMSHGVITGHIHIALLSKDGSVVKEANQTLGQTLHRGKLHFASYRARLTWTLPPGSIIRISLSGDQHPAE